LSRVLDIDLLHFGMKQMAAINGAAKRNFVIAVATNVVT
jgi:hypothetical protein